MSVLYIALPIALMLGAGGLWACLYCIRDGQYDDLDTPSVRVLLEDRRVDEGPSEATGVSSETDPPSGPS
jgi:cbb3-type cytochrome oxidase maturation protein